MKLSSLLYSATDDAERSSAQNSSSGAPAAREGGTGITKYVPEGLYYAHEQDDDDSWKEHSFAAGKAAQQDPMQVASSANDYVVLDSRKGE